MAKIMKWFPNGSKIGFVEADRDERQNGQKIKGINAVLATLTRLTVHNDDVYHG